MLYDQKTFLDETGQMGKASMRLIRCTRDGNGNNVRPPVTEQPPYRNKDRYFDNETEEHDYTS
jgi:hypothetical protein